MTKTCPKCKGSGQIVYNCQIDAPLHTDYSESEIICDTRECKRCNGIGKIHRIKKKKNQIIK